jgi:C-terminal processing protease CtpA/Prc
MKKLLHLPIGLLALLILVIGCSSSTGNDGKNDEFIDENSWIRETMSLYYFWNDLVPDQTDGSINPVPYFQSMLDSTDTFSYIVEDAEELNSSLEGSAFTTGISPGFGIFAGTNEVFFVIEFVYPNTPAAEAGLNRGDIVLEVDGQTMTTSNYLELYYSGNSTIDYTLGEYLPDQNAIANTDSVVTVNQLELDLDPIAYTNVYEYGDRKIGYLFYARFLNGKDDVFIESMDNALQEFSNQGINELVVDLRYNPGGRISAAENIANSIVPLSVAQSEEVFVSFQYNEGLQNFYEEQQGPNSPNLFVRFDEDPINLGLERVFFLTTSGSASASELIINGLDPHMGVIHIGENTFGKFYGSFVFTGDEATPPNNYGIVPVTLKYANSLGVTDFRDGLTPDYVVPDSLVTNPYDIGDVNDAMFKTAIDIITGNNTGPAKIGPRRYEMLPDWYKLKRGNILGEKSVIK